MSGYIPKTHTSVAVGTFFDVLVFLLVAVVLLDAEGGDLFWCALGWFGFDVALALWKDTR